MSPRLIIILVLAGLAALGAGTVTCNMVQLRPAPCPDPAQPLREPPPMWNAVNIGKSSSAVIRIATSVAGRR